eukprot:1374691-Pyramimonas_sp.AAC.1
MCPKSRRKVVAAFAFSGALRGSSDEDPRRTLLICRGLQGPRIEPTKTSDVWEGAEKDDEQKEEDEEKEAEEEEEG